MGDTLVRLVKATYNTRIRLDAVHGSPLADKRTAKVGPHLNREGHRDDPERCASRCRCTRQELRPDGSANCAALFRCRGRIYHGG